MAALAMASLQTHGCTIAPIPMQVQKATTKIQCNDEAVASTDQPAHLCPRCGARMIIIETFAAGCVPRHRPSPNPIAIRIDTS